ncbi:hypothetical protein BPNPMPFG_000786 [Mesorhizobium sp. AR07]|uniref:hypothetical protein n=1 Tax=Mesorhizobium sp. AR07 TaxID=2865838 RepID=UPI00215DEAB9|nr:hypothetical protein [Mesorhizobium sp. AR07]UVK45270.1 hypothetical protein BPNPMPFG_000786 [Mesorhizobium sp. AR07]
MRTFFTSLFAFIISGLAGGLVAQQLAVITNAQEEYILVFMASVLVTIVLTFIFFVAQFMTDPLAAVDKTGMWSLIVLAVLIGLLIALILYTDASMTAVKGDIPMIIGLGLPGLVTILVQWLFVHWRVRHGLTNARVSG